MRGTAAELAERYAEGEVRGEVVLVVGRRADAAAGDEAAAVDALRPAGRRGRAHPAGGRGRGRADGRERQRALPRAHQPRFVT